MTTVPSSPTDRQTLKVMIVNLTNCYARMDGEKDAIKEILSEAEEKFGIKKKTISKLAKVMYSHTYNDIVEENENFQLLYENLIEGKKSTSAEPITQKDDDDTE